TLDQRELPSMLWPFNFGVLKSPQTKILNSLSDEGPGVTIMTPPHSAFSVRAPISGRMLQVNQTDHRSTVILKPEDSLLVVLGNLTEVTLRPQELRENE